MKLPKELIPIVLILAALIAINVFRKRGAPARSPQATNVEYTSYSTGERGTKALYLLLEKLGYKPRRLRVPHLTATRAEGLAIVLVPGRPSIDRTDVERLLEWVRQGNTLLFAPNEYEDQLAGSLGIKLHRGRSLETSIAPFAFTNLTVGIQRLVVRSGDRVVTERMDVLQHFRDSVGGVVVSLREGAGTVVVLSDPYLMTNAGLPEGDNLTLLTNILFSYADAKTVYFDEYHHGFERRPTLLHLFRSTSLGWALLQVAAAVVLLMYSRGRRFGRPKPPRTRGEAHRLSVEYVTSLAGIYRTAQASSVALSNLRERLLRSVKSPSSSESIRELMDQCERKMRDPKINEKDLIDLSRRMELARHP
jgi:hypothetical protein